MNTTAITFPPNSPVYDAKVAEGMEILDWNVGESSELRSRLMVEFVSAPTFNTNGSDSFTLITMAAMLGLLILISDSFGVIALERISVNWFSLERMADDAWSVSSAFFITSSSV